LKIIFCEIDNERRPVTLIETTKIVFVFVFYRSFALDPLRELMTLYP